MKEGRIAFVKIEHVWVEAYLDFFPSRGTKHITGDTWIPIDCSFKQYQFIEGMDIQNNVPFDTEGFVEHITNTAQINETEGWVSGIDQTFMETALQNYQTQIETYITQTNPAATVGEVLGTQTIIPTNNPVFATSLPYPIVARGGTYKELPANLRHSFKFSLYANETDRILDNPTLSLNQSLPELAGKRLTLSFEPATNSDRQVIESYLPEVAEGQELDPNDLPTSLPGYLIHLKAQLKLDGEIIAESGNFTMGQELSSTTGITRMTGGWHLAYNKPIAGEFYAFGIDGQSISEQQLAASRGGTLAGALHKAALLYFHANDIYLKSLGQTPQAIAYRQPSFGTFSTNLEVIYSFGVPRQVETVGILVDMDVVTQSLCAKDNDIQRNQAVGQQLGMMISSLEHRVPELFFSNETTTSVAVSAVKALAIASPQGQRVYQITSANAAMVLPSLNIDSQVKEEIRNSVAVGKVATVSQQNVTVSDWTGVGYIIADPQTGAGAYRISGGSNGGSLIFTANVQGIIGLLMFTGLGMLTSIVADLFPFDGDCGEEDIVKELIFAAILAALIVVIIILVSQQPWLFPVLTMLMTMFLEAVFAASPKYKRCDSLPYTCKIKDDAFSAAQLVINEKLVIAEFLPDPLGSFGLVGQEHSYGGRCPREHAYHDEILRYTGNHPGSLVGCDCCLKNKSIEQRWGITLKSEIKAHPTLPKVGEFSEFSGNYLVDSIEIWQTGYCLD
jgi:hypothetical protein